MRRILLLTLGFVLALDANAADVRIRLNPELSAEACAHRGWLVGRAAVGDVSIRVPLREGETVYRLSLTADQAWELGAELEGCWSETIVWSPTESAEVSLNVYRAGSIGGEFETEAEPTEDLKGLIFPLRGSEIRGDASGGGIPVSCELDFPRWHCLVPANISFDLRLDLPGFASIHYWSVRATSQTVQELEPQQLVAGASLSGWVQDSEGVLRRDAQVTLYPLEADESRLDKERVVARRRAVMTNERGFFQFTGLEPGSYRLVSELIGLSPATVPEVRVREGESVVWPRAIAHAPFATLEVAFYPAIDPDGERWMVELNETTSLHLERGPSLKGRATIDGQWTAKSLRADLYRLIVRNKNGSELERIDVDLTEGGLKDITVNVRSLRVRGVLRMGDEPLRAEVSFTNFTGKFVRVTTSEDGRFEARFPAGGKWIPEIRYPAGRSGSTVILDPVEVLPGNGGEAEIELLVPGGRIRGEVVSDGAAVRAAVHVIRNGHIVAQVVTPETGKFDFIGMRSGAYALDAEGEPGATPEPVQIEVEGNQVRDVRLTLAPFQWVSGTVFTPAGTPASGAVIHVLRDGGQSWIRIVTDVSGRFEYRTPAGSGDGGLVVVTYSYPSALIRVPANRRGPVVITLKPEGGILRIRNGAIPYIRSPHASAPMRAFYFPDPRGRFNGGVYLEMGTYLVCPGRQVDGSCQTVTIAPGADVEVDFSEGKKEAGR